MCIIAFWHCEMKAETISLKQAIDSALSHNYEIKNQTLLAEYRATMKDAGYTIEQAVLAFDYGQINSVYTDSKISLSQRYQFPTVYAKQQSLLNEEWNAAVLNKDVTIAHIKKAVADIYFYLLILKEKEQMLVYADSIYAEFIQKARYRYQKGETNILETSTQEAERGTIRLQLQDIRTALNYHTMQFQLLLNTDKNYEPVKSALQERMKSQGLTDITLHPALKHSRQSIQTAMANKELEQSKLLPDIQIGLSNHSIQGVGADNMDYPVSRRFNSITLGIGIPHPFGAQSAIIDAAETNVRISEYEYQYQVQKHQRELQSAIARRDTMLGTIEFMEQTQLPNVSVIQEAANKQYAAGEINYLEWTIAINQSMTIRNNYIQALQSYFEIVNTITYLQEQ